MSALPLNFSNIIEYLKEYHYVDKNDMEDLSRCYNLLESYYSGLSDDADSSLDHSITVAQYIATWRFDLDVISAALFHDCTKNNQKEIQAVISEAAYGILEDYYKIRRELEVITSNSQIEKIVEANLLPSGINPESFYIVIAERIDLLSRVKDETSDFSLSLAQTTREVLIPQIQKIHAHNLVDLLEELCFQIENRDVYNAISKIVSNSDSLNDFYRQQTLTKLRQIFDKDSNIVPSSLRAQAKILYFLTEKRSIVSLHRFGIKKAPSFEYALKKLSNKQKTSYIDLTLVLEENLLLDSKQSVDDIFLEYYCQLLKSEGFYLRGYCATTSFNSKYYLMSDRMQNLYRFFIKTESDYLLYFYGDIINKDNVGLGYMPPAPTSKIKVFKPDGTAVRVDIGTTALDFAFLIHEDIGLHFQGGNINHNGKTVFPYTELKNGDTVEIKKSKEITAELRWFRYVKSDLAINRLIKYFNTKLGRSSPKMVGVLTKDGTYAQIEEGSTVLDFAFLIHPDMGLHFDSAMVNNSKVPINYVLQDQDNVIIRKSREHRASISWFRHVRTAKAINELISFFRVNGIPEKDIHR